MRILKTIILAFITVGLCYSESWDSRHYKLDISTGLPSNTIHEIYQDHFGIIWLATSKNLVKYDGQDYKLYSLPELNADEFIDNKIFPIKEGADNSLWIATDHGFCRFNRYSETYEYLNQPEIDSKHLKDALVSSRGKELLCIENTNGVYNYSDKTLYTLQTGNDTNTFPHSIQELNDSTFLVATHSSGLFLLHIHLKTNKNNFKQIFKGDIASNLIKSKNGTFWFFTDKSIYSFTIASPGNQKVKQEYPLPESTNSNAQLLIDQENNIHLLTGSQLISYNPKDRKSFVSYQFEGGRKKAIFDIENNLWTLSINNGIDIYFKTRQITQLIPQQYLTDNIGDYRIRDIKVAEHNNFLVATHGGGIAEINLSNNRCRPYTINKYLPKNEHELQNRIALIYHYKDNLYWIANESMGLYQFNTVNKSLNKFFNYHCLRQIQDNSIIKIIKQDKNKYWFATKNKGVYLLDLKKDSIISHYHENQNDLEYRIKTNKITDIAIDTRSHIWIGTEQGLIQVKPTKIKTHVHKSAGPNSLWSNKINCLFVDNRGNIWIGTDKGLNRYSQRIKALKRYECPENYENPGVYDIYQDTNNYLWLMYDNNIQAFKLIEVSS